MLFSNHVLGHRHSLPSLLTGGAAPEPPHPEHTRNRDICAAGLLPPASKVRGPSPVTPVACWQVETLELNTPSPILPEECRVWVRILPASLGLRDGCSPRLSASHSSLWARALKLFPEVGVVKPQGRVPRRKPCLARGAGVEGLGRG